MSNFKKIFSVFVLLSILFLLGMNSFANDDHTKYKIGYDEPIEFTNMNPNFSDWNSKYCSSLTKAQKKALGYSYVAAGKHNYCFLAASYLYHYLENNGTSVRINFNQLNKKDSTAKKHRNNEIDYALKFAEKFAEETSGSFQIVSTNVAQATFRPWRSLDYFSAIGKYYTIGKGRVYQLGNNEYRLTFYFKFRDIYDFNKGDLGYLNDELSFYSFKTCGIAKPFLVQGTDTIIIKWKKGDRFSDNISKNPKIENTW